MARARRKSPPQPVVFGTPNFANRTLFQGDNLDVMRGINSETIDLIATDPPFNKGRDFHATSERLKGAKFEDRWIWEEDVQGEWVDRIKNDHPIDIARATRWAQAEENKRREERIIGRTLPMGVEES